MSSQGTQEPRPVPTGGPKGRPMETVPGLTEVAVWDGVWTIAHLMPDGRWFAIYAGRVVVPKCWLPLHEALDYVPPPVLP